MYPKIGLTNQFGNIFYIKQDLFRKEQLENRGIQLYTLQNKQNSLIYPFVISYNLRQQKETNYSSFEEQFIRGKYINSLTVADLDYNSKTYRLLLAILQPQSRIPQPNKYSYVNYNNRQEQLFNLVKQLSNLFNGKEADNIFLYLFKTKNYPDKDYQQKELIQNNVIFSKPDGNVVDQQIEELYGDSKSNYITYEEYIRDFSQQLLQAVSSLRGFPITDVINDMIIQFGQYVSGILSSISRGISGFQSIVNIANPILTQIENERDSILKKQSGEYVYTNRYGVNIQPSVDQYKMLSENEQMSIQASVFILKRIDMHPSNDGWFGWWKLFEGLLSFINKFTEQIALGFKSVYIQDDLSQNLFSKDLGGTARTIDNKNYKTFEHTYQNNRLIQFDFIQINIEFIKNFLPGDTSIQNNLFLIKPQHGFEKILSLSNNDIISFNNFENNFISGENKQFSLLHYNKRNGTAQSSILFLVDKIWDSYNTEGQKMIYSSIFISFLKKQLKQIVVKSSKQDQRGKISLSLEADKVYINAIEIKKVDRETYLFKYNIFYQGDILQDEVIGIPDEDINIFSNDVLIARLNISKDFFDNIEVGSIYYINPDDVIDDKQETINDQQSQRLVEFINRLNITLQTYPEQQGIQNEMMSQIFQQLIEHVVYFEDNIYDSLINLNNMIHEEGQKEDDLQKIIYQLIDMLYRLFTEDLGFIQQVQDILDYSQNQYPILYNIFKDVISSQSQEVILDETVYVKPNISIENNSYLKRLLQKAEQQLKNNLEKDYLYTITFSFSSNNMEEVIDLTKTVQYQDDNGLSMILNLINSKYTANSLVQQLNTDETMRIKIQKKSKTVMGLSNISPLVIYAQFYSFIIMYEEQLSYNRNLWEQFLDVLFSQLHDIVFLFKYLWFGKMTNDDNEIEKMNNDLAKENDTYTRIKIIQSYMENSIKRKKAEDREYTKDELLEVKSVFKKFRLDNQITFTVGYWMSTIFQYMDIFKSIAELISTFSFTNILPQFQFDKGNPFYVPAKMILTSGYEATPILRERETGEPEHEDTTIPQKFDVYIEKGRLIVSSQQDLSIYDGITITLIDDNTGEQVFYYPILHQEYITIDIYKNIFYDNNINDGNPYYDRTYTFIMERLESFENYIEVQDEDRLILKIKFMEPIHHVEQPDDTDLFLIDRYYPGYTELRGYGFKYLGNMTDFQEFVYATGDALNNQVDSTNYGDFNEDWFIYNTLSTDNIYKVNSNIYLDFNAIYGYNGQQDDILFGKKSIKDGNIWNAQTDVFTKAQKGLVYRIRPTEKINIHLDSYYYTDTNLVLSYSISKDFQNTSFYGNTDTTHIREEVRNVIERINSSYLQLQGYESISITDNGDYINVKVEINKQTVSGGQNKQIKVLTPNILYWRDSDAYVINILKVPSDIHWHESIFGLLSWTAIQGQDYYEITLFRNNDQITSFRQTDNRVDASVYVDSPGSYYVSIKQKSNTSIDSDIYTMDPSKYLVVEKLSPPQNARPQIIEYTDPETGEHIIEDDISKITWDQVSSGDFIVNTYRFYQTKHNESYEPGPIYSVDVYGTEILYEQIKVLFRGDGIYSFDVQQLSNDKKYKDSDKTKVLSNKGIQQTFYFRFAEG